MSVYRVLSISESDSGPAASAGSQSVHDAADVGGADRSVVFDEHGDRGRAAGRGGVRRFVGTAHSTEHGVRTLL